MTMRFSASVAGRLMACPASANLDVAIPNWVEPVKDETAGQKAVGTRYHQILEPIMELGAKDIGHFAAVLAYVAELRSQRRFKVLVEEKVTAEWLATKPSTTADLVLYVQDEIHVIDFKWGKIPVDVFDNKQLLFYAACYAPLAPKAKGVHLHIVQPYADNFDQTYVTTSQLAVFMDEAVVTEQKIQAKDTTFGPSDECKFCPANPHSRGDKGKPLCPAMMDLLYPQIIDEAAVLDL